MVACVIIDHIQGPSVIQLGSEVEYILDLRVREFEGMNLTPRPNAGSLWVSYLAVDVPEGWTIDSGHYEGVIGGVPVSGEGVVRISG